jgi:hypothetical protein
MLWPGDSDRHQKPVQRIDVTCSIGLRHVASMSPWAKGEWRRSPLPALSRLGVDDVSGVFSGVGRCEAGEAVQRVVLTNQNTAELVSRDERASGSA